MARMPKRDPRTGKFLKGSTTARKRRAAPKRKAAPRTRRSYRRNPATPDVVAMLRDGTITAGQILIGKAAARSIPDLMGFARSGTPGLAIQAAVAVAAGYAASMFLSPQAGAAILAGGMTAPLEAIAIQENIPWLGEALNPALSGYVTAPRVMGAYPKRLNGYVPARRPYNGAAGVVTA